MKNSLKLAAIATALLISGSLSAGTEVGNYSATCFDCKLSLDKKELSCFECNGKDGKPKEGAKLDVSKVPGVADAIDSLNANISNCDGKLVDAPKCADPVK